MTIDVSSWARLGNQHPNRAAAIAARIVDAGDDKEHDELLRKLNEQQAENQQIKAQLRELTETIKRL